MNAVEHPQILFRSLATRGGNEVPAAIDDCIAACKAAGDDLVVVETPGIGQGDAGIVDHVDLPIYVMTPEVVAASQHAQIKDRTSDGEGREEKVSRAFCGRLY